MYTDPRYRARYTLGLDPDPDYRCTIYRFEFKNEASSRPYCGVWTRVFHKITAETLYFYHCYVWTHWQCSWGHLMVHGPVQPHSEQPGAGVTDGELQHPALGPAAVLLGGCGLAGIRLEWIGLVWTGQD